MEKILRYLSILFLGLYLCNSGKLSASHVRGSELTYTYLGGNQYRILLTLYRDCSGVSASTSFTLNIQSSCSTFTTTLNQSAHPTTGQASGTNVSQLCNLSDATCAGGSQPGTEVYYYTATVTLNCQANDWVFYTGECCRNAAITNLQTPDSYDMYVEARLNNTIGNNSSPVFANRPLGYICANNPISFSNIATEPNGDVLVYSLVQPMDALNTPIPYVSGFSATYPLTTSPANSFNFDSNTGQMTFTPTAGQTAVVSVRIDEYRNGVFIGSVLRDIQLVVLNCTNQPPTSAGLNTISGASSAGGHSVSLCAGGGTVRFNVPATDPEGNNITMSAIGLSNLAGATFTIANNNTANPVGTLNWNVPIGASGTYTFTVALQDNNCPIPGTNAYPVSVSISNITPSASTVLVCGATPGVITVTGGSTYTWSPTTNLTCLNPPFCSQVSVNPNTNTLYTVTNECGQSTAVSALFYPGFTSSIVSSNNNICSGGFSNLTVNNSVAGTYTYVWTPSTGLSCSNCANPVATPSTTTTYQVTVTDGNGCTATASNTINVSAVPVPSASAAVDKYVVCAGQTVNLTATGCIQDYTLSNIAYSAADTGTVGGWTTIAATNEVATIPFTFKYFCNNYSAVKVNKDGRLFFSATPLDLFGPTISPIPTAGNGDDYIAVIFARMEFGCKGGEIRYQTFGTAPNRRFVVHYREMVHYGSIISACPTTPTRVNAHVILYEGSNNIEIHIARQTNTTRTLVVGLENSTGTYGVSPTGYNNVNFRVNTPAPAGGTLPVAFRFVPKQPNYLWTASPATAITNSTTANASATPAVSTTFTVTITDPAAICSSQVNLPVQVRSAVVNDVSICSGGYATLTPTLSGPASNVPIPSCVTGTCSGGTTTEYQLGAGTTGINSVFPNSQTDSRNQFLLRAADLLAIGVQPGYLTSLSLYFQAPIAANGYNMNIKLGCTTASTITSTSFTAGLTTVYTNASFLPVQEWNKFNFSSGYVWDGQQNILVEICFTGHVPACNAANAFICLFFGVLNDNVNGTNVGYGTMLSATAASAGCTIASGTISNVRPNVKFDNCVAPPTYTWSVVSGPGTIASGGSTSTMTTSTLTANTTYQVVVNYGICSVTDQAIVSIGGPTSTVWDGSVDNDWFKAANWSTNCLPTCNTDVLIPNVPNKPHIATGNVLGLFTGACKSITINTGSWLKIQGGYRLDVCGHYTTYQNAADYVLSGTTGTIAFVGSANQNFYAANPTTFDFPSIVINNGSTVTLLSDMNIKSDKTLTFDPALGGRIVTNAFEVFVKNNASASIVGHRANSYIQGNLRRAIIGTNSYDIPVGLAPAPTDLGYQLANVTFTTAPTVATNLYSYFVDFISTSTPSVSFTECGDDYECIFPYHGKWVIDPNLIGTYTYTVSLYPTNYGTPTCAANEWTVMKKPTGLGSWSLQGTVVCPHSSSLAPVTRGGFTTFSEFAPAGAVTTTLPVEQILLDAKALSSSIQVDWKGVREKNISGYMLKRSINGTDFSDLTFISSNPQAQYSFEDPNVNPGQLYYYQAIAMDYNGNQYFSNVDAAMIDSDVWNVFVYPNPANDQIILSQNNIQGHVSVELYDLLGKKLMTKELYDIEQNAKTEFDLKNLASGTYYFRINSQSGQQTIRFVKK